VAEAGRNPLRLGVVLALAVVTLFEVLTLLQGVRSTRRLQMRATRDVQRVVEEARGPLTAGLRRGGRLAWDQAARQALDLGLASEVEVLDLEGQTLFSLPTSPPVLHRLSGDQRERVATGRVVTTVAQGGPRVRALSYVPFVSGERRLVLRLATPLPDLEEELQERRQVLLGHGVALGALLLAAVLVLLPRRREEASTPQRALVAYEEAMELLRDRDEELTARHEAERRRMAERMREKDALARAGELTAGIVHEVRNGLGTIVGYARLLEREPSPAGAEEAARSIREECETLETVVRRFNEFIRQERLNLAELDLARLLERVVARETRGRHGLRTTTKGLEAPVLVRGDEELLERAFENLVRNAAEAAGGGGGRIEIEAVAAADAVEIRVSDNGPGLAADHPRDVRPFYTTKAGGLGLGLPLARKVLLLHGGELQLVDDPGSGLTVRVLLSRAGPPS
jgi:signal transduction histidine kinase